MTVPSRRSTSFKGRSRRSPTGKQLVIGKPKKPSRASCALCHGFLHGVPKRSPGQLAKLSKTEKRPERMYGGILCANCMQQLAKEKARIQSGIIEPRNLDLTHLQYLNLKR